MALIKCSNCGKEISDTSKKCVYCNKRNRKSNRGKQKAIIIIIFIVLLVIISIKTLQDIINIPQIKDKEAKHHIKYKAMESIDIDKYLKLKEESNISIIYIYRNNCEYCTKQKFILHDIITNHNLKIYGLNYGSMNKEEQDRFNLSDEYFEGGLFGTPFIAITENNKIIDTLEGLKPQEILENLFRKYKLI